MKKILSLILCTVMLLSFGAFAEEQIPSVWTMTVDGIELTIDDQTIVVNPTLESTFGSDENGLWGTGSVKLNGESLLSIQGRFANNTVYGTVEGAQDCLSFSGVIDTINGLLALAETETQLSEEDLSIYMTLLFTLLDDTSWIDEIAPEMSAYGMSIEVLGERDYALSFSEEGVAVKLHIAWAPAVATAPDFSALNEIALLNPSVEEIPENDVDDALLAGISRIMDDSSVQQLMALYDAMMIEMQAELDALMAEDIETEMAG